MKTKKKCFAYLQLNRLINDFSNPMMLTSIQSSYCFRHACNLSVLTKKDFNELIIIIAGF